MGVATFAPWFAWLWALYIRRDQLLIGLSTNSVAAAQDRVGG